MRSLLSGEESGFKEIGSLKNDNSTIICTLMSFQMHIVGVKLFVLVVKISLKSHLLLSKWIFAVLNRAYNFAF